MKTLISLLLSASLLTACSESSKSVNLRDAAPAPAPSTGNKPTEKPGTPTPTPTPEETAPDQPGEESPTSPSPTPTPAPIAVRAARFICETQLNNSRSFNTLRADSVSNFMMPSLVPSMNGIKVNYVKSAVPLTSDGSIVFFILRAQEDGFTPWKIYKATGNLLSTTANMEVLSNYQGIPPKGGYAYENLKMDRRILGANIKRSAYVYPADNGTYFWESLKGTKFSVPFNADSSFNPTFVGGDDYLRFDQETSDRVLTQKFYHFDTKKTLSLPSPVDSKDNQLFGYVNAAKNTLYWVEGRPEGTWKVRAISLNTPAKGMTLGTLSGTASAIRLPMVFVEHKGESLLAYNEELMGTDRSGLPILKNASIQLVNLSAKQAKITAVKSVPYSDEIKGTARHAAVLNGGILAGLFLEPISGRLYSTNLAGGGLASFDLNENTWSTHGMVGSVFGCFSPEWGIEVINE